MIGKKGLDALLCAIAGAGSFRSSYWSWVQTIGEYSGALEKLAIRSK
jgi:hypothetical protein